MKDLFFRKNIVFGIVILFVATNFITLTGSLENERNNWWNTDWSYYRILPIANPSNSYQMKIVVGKSTGGDVNCNGHCKDDFSDIRFLDKDNSTVLSYWMEDYSTGDKATFWVKLSSDVETDGAIILYYGNSNANSLSNGDATFLTFIDDTTGWTGDTQILSMSSGRIKMYENSATAYYCYHPISTDSNNDVIVDAKIEESPLDKNLVEFEVTDGATPFNSFSGIESTDYSAPGYQPLNGYYYWVNLYNGSDVAYPIYTPWAAEKNREFREVVRTSSAKVDYYLFEENGMLLGSAVNQGYMFSLASTITHVMLRTSTGRGTFAYISWIRVRKYVSPEPLWGTPGQEQPLPIPDTVYIDDNFSSSTPGWGYDHFNIIQDGIDAVAEGGTVYVYNGVYYENVNVDKTINLIGEDKNNTIIDGAGDDVVYISADLVNISGFTIWHGYNGVHLDSSDGNDIFGNIIISNIDDGIDLDSSSFNVISDNTIFSNGWCGITLSASNNNNNVIFRNIISGNNYHGIDIESPSTSNQIYYNNFINNIIGNGFDNSNNLWYSSTFLKGNYWSDYTGEDNNYDSIGDTPYPIPGGSNQDLYPLMTLFGPPYADFTFTINDKNVLFDASLSYDYNGNIISYQWDFGDGQSGAGLTISHTYSNYGTYEVTLEVTDNDYITDSISKDVTIVNEMPPWISNLQAIPPVQVVGGYVNISAQVIDDTGLSDVCVLIRFPDNHIENISIIENKNNDTYYYNTTYDTLGLYSCWIWAVDIDGNKATSLSIYFTITNDFICDADGPYNGFIYDEIQFNGYAVNGEPPYTWYWDFGDGSFSDEQNPVHAYDYPDNFTIILTVTDKYGIIATDTTWAMIKDCPYLFPPSINGPTKGKPDVKYDYNFLSTDPSGDDYYLKIDWGDGTITGWLGPYHSCETVTDSHSWSEKGTYTIKAKVKNNCMESDWGRLDITIPRYKIITNIFLQRFFQNHPFLQKLLNRIGQ
jgi:parallel beta-helix repeat protein